MYRHHIRPRQFLASRYIHPPLLYTMCCSGKWGPKKLKSIRWCHYPVTGNRWDCIFLVRN
jgi:hypothetical protein